MSVVTEAPHIHVSGGGLEGEYIVEDVQSDGRLIVRPADSAAAMRARHGLTPATLEEFEAVYGPLAPPDDEG